MRSAHVVIAAALAAAVSAPALAQAPSRSAASQASAAPTFSGATRNVWTASGFLGTSFETTSTNAALDNTGTHIDVGGELAWLWRGVIGAELLADFAPSVNVDSPAVARTNVRVNTYMGNAIGAIPFGSSGQFQPYASGGVGMVGMTADVLNTPGDPASGIDKGRQGRIGTNVGGGLMAFAGDHVGFRTDVRWYRISEDNNPSTTIAPADQVTQQLLSGLEFWRANFGVALRW